MSLASCAPGRCLHFDCNGEQRKSSTGQLGGLALAQSLVGHGELGKILASLCQACLGLVRADRAPPGSEARQMRRRTMAIFLTFASVSEAFHGILSGPSPMIEIRISPSDKGVIDEERQLGGYLCQTLHVSSPNRALAWPDWPCRKFISSFHVQSCFSAGQTLEQTMGSDKVSVY